MGLVAVGPKWQRRIARVTGLNIVWANGSGGYELNFTTTAHRHGQFHIKEYREALKAAPAEPGPEWWRERGVWDLDAVGACWGFSSCRKLFPADFASTATREEV